MPGDQAARQIQRLEPAAARDSRVDIIILPVACRLHTSPPRRSRHAGNWPKSEEGELDNPPDLDEWRVSIRGDRRTVVTARVKRTPPTVHSRPGRRQIIRRVLVPLDGTAPATGILPDACRLAGRDGVVTLLDEVVSLPTWNPSSRQEDHPAVQASREYLRGIADGLRAEHVSVETQALVVDDVARGIDQAAITFGADMVAVASHVPPARERLSEDSIAWLALTDSSVPVLIRHIADTGDALSAPEPRERRIMVPLDGSARAERALPVADELAIEWNASISLVHVVSHDPITKFAYTEIDPHAVTDDVACRAGRRYLDRIAAQFGRHVQTRVLLGSPVDELVAATAAWSISDVVLSGRGRTGLAHPGPGSVTDSLLHRLHLPMVVVPSSASDHPSRANMDREKRPVPSGGEMTKSAPNAVAENGKQDYRHIVVALDGSKDAEAIFPYVEPLARAFNSSVTFVCTLVPVEDTVSGAMELTQGSMAPTLLQSVYETHDLAGQAEGAYLARVKSLWAARGIDVECREPRMRASDAVVEIAREQGADLIAMTTHGRHGIARTMQGSVADTVVRTAPCPVLLLKFD